MGFETDGVYGFLAELVASFKDFVFDCLFCDGGLPFHICCNNPNNKFDGFPNHDEDHIENTVNGLAQKQNDDVGDKECKEELLMVKLHPIN